MNSCHLSDYKPKHYIPLVDKNNWPTGMFITGGKGGGASKKSEWKPLDCYMADINGIPAYYQGWLCLFVVICKMTGDGNSGHHGLSCWRLHVCPVRREGSGRLTVLSFSQPGSDQVSQSTH